ncbi:MAG TPA: hypothetical protein VFS56_11445 [Gemmatimonadaceae bacterium]|nr:hypothetical protein [Gemmatimonadaceae bacterium]
MHETRSTRNAAAVAVTVLIALTACPAFSTAPTHDVVVQTAQTLYQIPPGTSNLTIEATVTNAMDRTLLLDGIGRDFFGLEKRVGDSWRWAYSPVHILPLVPNIELPPGGSRKLTFGLYVGGAPNTYPQFEYEIPGTYRAVFGFGVQNAGGFKVYSNEFELRASE